MKRASVFCEHATCGAWPCDSGRVPYAQLRPSLASGTCWQSAWIPDDLTVSGAVHGYRQSIAQEWFAKHYRCSDGVASASERRLQSDQQNQTREASYSYRCTGNTATPVGYNRDNACVLLPALLAAGLVCIHRHISRPPREAAPQRRVFCHRRAGKAPPALLTRRPPSECA